MKRLSLILLLMIFYAPVIAQETPEEEQMVDKKENRVPLFTQEERDNLQLWYYNRFQEMKLTEEQEARYQSTITYYTVKMVRLEDKDLELTAKEKKARFKSYLSKQDWEVRNILTPEQYSIHEEIYGEFLRSISRRLGMEGEKDEEAKG